MANIFSARAAAPAQSTVRADLSYREIDLIRPAGRNPYCIAVTRARHNVQHSQGTQDSQAKTHGPRLKSRASQGLNLTPPPRTTGWAPVRVCKARTLANAPTRRRPSSCCLASALRERAACEPRHPKMRTKTTSGGSRVADFRLGFAVGLHQLFSLLDQSAGIDAIAWISTRIVGRAMGDSTVARAGLLS